MCAIPFVISLERLQFLPAPAARTNALACADWQKRTALQLKTLLSYASHGTAQSTRGSNG